MGINGKVASQVRYILDAAGQIIGYKNPVSDADEALPTAGLQALVSRAGIAPYQFGRGSLYPLSARNGQCVNTAAGTNPSQQSIRRRRRNGLVAAGALRVRLANWYVTNNSTGVETANPNDIKVSVSIEYPSGAKPRPLTVNGSTSSIVPAGGTVDAIEATGLVIPAGGLFYTHMFVQAVDAAGAYDSAGSVPYGRFAENTAGLGCDDRVLRGATAVNLTTTIGGETTVVPSPVNIYSEFAILGEPVAGAVAQSAPIIVGDSIGYGYNEHLGPSSDTAGNVGPWERWMGSATAGMGMVNCSSSGIAALACAGIATGAYARLTYALRDIGTHVVLATGRNDFAGTVVALAASINAQAAYWRAAGYKVFAITVTPNTDAGNTTTDAGTNAKRLDWNNNYVRAGALAVDGYIDLADRFESARDSGLWVSGTYTSDGLHPSATANAAFAAAMPAPSVVFV